MKELMPNEARIGEWIPCSDKLPRNGQWVLGAVESIHDGYGAPKMAVVRFNKGISQKQREALAEKGDDRANLFYGADEWGNNLVPYNWDEWGPTSYFGQNITAWMPLPEHYRATMRGGDQNGRKNS